MKKLRPILLILLVLAVLGGVIVFRWAMQRPLGMPLTLELASEHATEDSQEAADQSLAQPTILEQSTAQKGIAGRPEEQEKFCGASGQMNLQVIGLGKIQDNPGQGADAIRLLFIDYDNPTIRMLAVPSNIWVQSPALAATGVETVKLEWVYPLAAAQFEGDSDRAVKSRAAGIFAQTLFNNFGYLPDHYVTIDETVFIEMVDTIGGIEILLDSEVDGTPWGYELFPKGQQNLDGERTLEFVRLVNPDSNVVERGRIERQNLVLYALLEAVKDQDNWPKALELAKQARKMVATDLSINQLRSLACMIEEIGRDVEMLSVTSEMLTSSAEDHRIPDREVIQEVFAQLQAQ